MQWVKVLLLPKPQHPRVLSLKRRSQAVYEITLSEPAITTTPTTAAPSRITTTIASTTVVAIDVQLLLNY